LKKHITNLEIKSMSFGPHGIATDPESGLKIFIENTSPLDIVEAEIYDLQKNMAFAELKKIVKAGPSRELDPECKLHKICGSCQWQHIKYSEQLEYKKANLIDAFKQNNIDLEQKKENGELLLDIKVKGLDTPFYFRNKVIYPVQTVKSSGRLLAGYYKTGSNDLINIKHCPIQYQIFDAIMNEAKALCSQFSIATPLLRHILLRANLAQTEVLVSFILRKKLLTANEKRKLKKIFQILIKHFPEIKAATINYNDDSTNVILGNETELICGEQDYITDSVKDVKVKISTSSFFQVNNLQFSNILHSIKSFIADAQYKCCLDAYSGIGSISLFLAKNFPSMNFHSFEVNPAAVNNAKENIKLNELTNLDTELASAEEYFQAKQNLDFDIIILNPPRKGCSNKILENVTKTNVKTIIYLSCNPSTLARDIKSLEGKGFSLKDIQAFDMFPHTYHLETLALLKRS